jgi:preprotein translocase subunit SecG
MEQIILVVHLLVALAIIGLIMLQGPPSAPARPRPCSARMAVAMC